ncbi:BtpA/SgcQ family protein [Bifidobacterium cebidarum]|uniref:SgcQ protein n=1 Tax=Bifidobacterium cebidarum TaxID=2650773 RepID=A0A6I1GNI2_9BIFI|nr:BtpA/SgcQ family protein [Bifidobacterium cebidarum]KAB7788111.1 SgcQ protein [Bifidobacterium cebidarum]
MNWLDEVFKVKKPVIAMCHLKPLPGDPNYDSAAGVEAIIEAARKDLKALQNGGVDGVMFSNEASLPYLLKTEPITAITMANIIGELKSEVTVPFGVNVLWDPTASIDLAVATGAKFVREIFSGVYASDFGLWNTNSGEVARHQRHVDGKNVKLLYNIVPESAQYLADRSIESIAKSTVFNAQPDGLCVSGLTAGAPADTDIITRVKGVVPDTPVFANTGVKAETAKVQLTAADGAICATYFKRDGYIWNEVDESRVAKLMGQVQELRAELG